MSSIKDQSEPSYLRVQHLRPLVFLVIAILLVVSGAIIWILNSVGTITGPWSDILSPAFTVLGVVIALLQSFSGHPHKTPTQTTTSPTGQLDQQSNHIQVVGIPLGVDVSKGALIVYARRYLRGSTINLCHGFLNVDLRIDAAESVVKRRIRGRAPLLLRLLHLDLQTDVAIFPTLEPGNYTVYTESRDYMTRVGIRAGQVTEVDWQ